MMKNVLEWLEASCKKNPDKISFGDDRGDITFRELYEGSRICGTYFAWYIDARDPVVFYLEKSNLAIRGMFGAVYAGGFYSLIDTRQPAERIHKILEVLEPKVISETTDIYTLLAGNLSVGDIVYPVSLTEPMDSEGVVSGTLVTETLSPASLFFDK